MHWGDIARRLGVLVLVAAVIAGGTALLPQVSEDTEGQQMQNAEWSQSATSVDQLPAKGEVKPSVNGASTDSGVVVIDTAHVNEFSRRDIEPLVKTLSGLGYTIRFSGTGSLDEALDGADAFVVIDPGTEFEEEEIADVKAFTDDGGRLLVLGEPDHVSVSAGLGGLSVRMEESELTTLASSYNLTFETRYLYNLQTNDGNYKHIVTTATERSQLENVETVTMYAATAVHAKRGRTLLRTAPGTHRDGSSATGQYGVAVRHGNVIAVGDKSFLEAGRHNIADNERFIAYLVEFLVTGDRTTDSGDSADTETDGSSGQPGNQTSNSTA